MQHQPSFREAKIVLRAQFCEGCAKDLSGITRADRLAPVCCIVFYYGEEPWEGPTRLHELIGFPPGLEELRELCPDFRINLVDWKRVNPKHFKTGLRQLFELLPYAKDKEKLCDYVKKNQSGYSDLTEECCDLLEGFLGVTGIGMTEEDIICVPHWKSL